MISLFLKTIVYDNVIDTIFQRIENNFFFLEKKDFNDDWTNTFIVKSRLLSDFMPGIKIYDPTNTPNRKQRDDNINYTAFDDGYDDQEDYDDYNNNELPF